MERAGGFLSDLSSETTSVRTDFGIVLTLALCTLSAEWQKATSPGMSSWPDLPVAERGGEKAVGRGKFASALRCEDFRP